MNKILNELNLIYYEYDKNTNCFIGDMDCSKEDKYKEFIKTTYCLTKKGYFFYSDEHHNIFISQKNSISNKIKNKLKKFIENIKYKDGNIFVLSDKKIKFAKNLPLLDTKTINIDKELLKVDALIFTSKNGVKHLNKQTSIWKDIPSYAISSKTGKKIKELGGKLKFVGKTKYGNSFAYELLEELQGKKVLYVGAKEVASNLVDILKEGGIDCDRAIVYESIYNDSTKKVKIPKKSSIIFSSPSTIKYFFKTYSWDESFNAICIGKTTAKALPKTIKRTISDTTSLESCVRKALEIK